ncbi:hypothetical protein NDU88_005998 [Pleurodeles waltl]|uniref:Uncharacterized protein n=1 Tax=Pleurodeles waltl TaxID=8319 RepID=A0AAV7WCA4_PLEWA|nr:hypothetical protein NDU88_005998 [Pleurodeles waltl]
MRAGNGAGAVGGTGAKMESWAAGKWQPAELVLRVSRGRCPGPPSSSVRNHELPSLSRCTRNEMGIVPPLDTGTAFN